MGISGVFSAAANTAFAISGTHNDPFPTSLICTVCLSNGTVVAEGTPGTVSNTATEFHFDFANGVSANGSAYETRVTGSQTNFTASLTVT